MTGKNFGKIVRFGGFLREGPTKRILGSYLQDVFSAAQLPVQAPY